MNIDTKYLTNSSKLNSQAIKRIRHNEQVGIITEIDCSTYGRNQCNTAY